MTLSESIRDEVAAIPVGPCDLDRVRRSGARRRNRQRLVGATAAVALVVAGTISGFALTGSDGGPLVAVDRPVTAAVTVPGTDGSVSYIPVDDRTGPVVVSGETLGGGTESTESYRGEVVLIRYWAEWCKPCSRDALTETAGDPGAGVIVVGGVIKNGSRVSSAANFASAHGFEFESIVDAPEALFEQFGSKSGLLGAPATVALDPDGRVAALRYGQFQSQTELDDFTALAR